MSANTTERLYNLLPEIYRLRDAEQGQPLRALLAVLSDELGAVEADITGLYENWFIETSAEWVVPYIGDLLGVRGLSSITSSAFSQRGYVANTLHYRRRKGTAYILEELARDVSGWPAHVVEFFEVLQTTQYMNHLRLFNTTPDLRAANQLNLTSTPFDALPRTADVRHIHKRRGKYNIPNIGLFVWRLQSYPLQNVTARKASNGYGYHFSPLGNPIPLYLLPEETGVSEEQQIPQPIRPLDFFFDLKAYNEQFTLAPKPADSRYYGPNRSLNIVKDGVDVTPDQIICKNLQNWDRPPAGKVAVDVTRGRLTFATGEEPAKGVEVSYCYGFSADIGGGPYERRERMAKLIPAVITEYPVSKVTLVDKPVTYATLASALTAWKNDGYPPAILRIYDSRTYAANLTIDLPAKGSLVIDADNTERPHLKGDLTLKAPENIPPAETFKAEDTAALTLSGLLLEGTLEVSGKLNLTLTDCTLVPGKALDEDGFPAKPKTASISVSGADVTDLSVTLSRCIIGPIEMPAECKALIINDSIVDAPYPKGEHESARAAISADVMGASVGPVTTLSRVTVFGEVHLKILELASEVVFTSNLKAERRQAGCVRYSHVPQGSETPRRYHCQPDLALAERAKELGLAGPADLDPALYAEIVLHVRPQFTSRFYGLAAYAQLSTACAEEIRTGAEDGSEMGAFCLLQQPQREANLQIALDEYLRFGLEAGIFFVS